MSFSGSNNIRVAKIFYLKEKNRPPLANEKEKVQLSAVHLSSIIQTQKKEAINQEMMQLAKKINQSNPFRPFLLTERPKSQHNSNSKTKFSERNIYSSVGMKTKKVLDPSSFYLSEIADEKWNGSAVKESQQAMNRFERSKSSKKNYKMRKYEFKVFLNDREAKPPIVNEKEIKQVIYEKEEINKWGQSQPKILFSRAHKISARRKHLQSQLQVLGSSFRIKKQGQILRHQS